MMNYKFISIVFLIFATSVKFLYPQKEKVELTELEKTALTIKTIPPISNQKSIRNPKVPTGYSIELMGTDRLQVINKNGEIYRPLVDAEVNLYYQLIDKKTGKRTDVPNILVQISGKYEKEESENPCPEIIPALREWKGNFGTLTFPNNGTIVIDTKNYDELYNSAALFAKELSFLGNRNYTINGGGAKQGEIFLTLNCKDVALGKEGYRLTIGNNMHLEANSPQGIFMGTRTLLQLLNKYGSEVPKGLVRDYPKYARRGFMIDVGRKFFKMDFLRDYVKIMSYYKMNEFHIHLNDNGFKQFFGNDWTKTYSAFRLESEIYPGLTAKDGSYSKNEFTELQRMGMEYGVNVIPEIDVPAHSLAFTHYLPGIGSKEYGMDHLDINNPKTYEFLDKLFDEYLAGENPVFIGPDVHVGTDEYDKKEAESFRKFTDYYLKKVQSYGKRARLWGSLTHAAGQTPVTSENVIMNA